MNRRRALEQGAALGSSPFLVLDSVASATSVGNVKVPTICLGNSGLRVSRTIQGHWQLAGGHGRFQEVDALENMKAHYDAGITTLDTADIYGISE